MVDLLCCREMPPAGRQIGDARHVGEGDNSAVIETDALLRNRLSGEPAIGLVCTCEGVGFPSVGAYGKCSSTCTLTRVPGGAGRSSGKFASRRCAKESARYAPAGRRGAQRWVAADVGAAGSAVPMRVMGEASACPVADKADYLICAPVIHQRPGTSIPYIFRMLRARELIDEPKSFLSLASPRGFEPLLPP